MPTYQVTANWWGKEKEFTVEADDIHDLQDHMRRKGVPSQNWRITGRGS